MRPHTFFPMLKFILKIRCTNWQARYTFKILPYVSKPSQIILIEDIGTKNSIFSSRLTESTCVHALKIYSKNIFFL